MFSHHLQLHKTARDTATDICGLSNMCRQHYRTGDIAGVVHEGTTASPAVKYNSIEQVMCADYSCSGCGVYEDFAIGQHYRAGVYVDIAIREHYRRCGAGASIYEDSAGPELVPGGEVCDGGQ